MYNHKNKYLGWDIYEVVKNKYTFKIFSDRKRKFKKLKIHENRIT